jgi:nucleotide-binding universal stress UspA family protein
MRTLAGRIGPALLLVAVGCHHTPPRVEPTFSYYHAPGLEWEKVSRVLVLPLDNESSFNQVPEQVRRALASEFQQAGRFEVVPAPPDVWAAVSSQVRQNGRFNEAVMIELARAARADLIVVGTVSQYSPYRLPRLGLTLQVVSPADAVVVASVDGLWDSTRLDIAGRARAYYREAAKGGRSAPFPETLALESPQYFQRFVCHEAVAALLAVPRPPPPPVVPVAGVDAGGKGAGKGGAGPVVPCATAKPCKTAPGCAGSPCAPNAAPAAPPLAGAPPRQMPKAPDEPKQDAPTVAAPMPDGPKLDVPPPDEPKPVAPMPDAPGRGPE